VSLIRVIKFFALEMKRIPTYSTAELNCRAGQECGCSSGQVLLCPVEERLNGPLVGESSEATNVFIWLQL
jgi:hypothetical protein